MGEREIPNTNAITNFFHCQQCVAEVETGEHDTSLQDYARCEVGYTPLGLQVWCLRHDANVIHLDFDAKGPFAANTTRAPGEDGSSAPGGDAPLTVDCDLHGRGAAAVVCGHLLEGPAPQGFVENSSVPGDYQAWCDACEARFDDEGGLTEAFRAFTRMSLVCEACYAAIAERHRR